MVKKMKKKNLKAVVLSKSNVCRNMEVSDLIGSSNDYDDMIQNGTSDDDSFSTENDAAKDYSDDDVTEDNMDGYNVSEDAIEEHDSKDKDNNNLEKIKNSQGSKRKMETSLTLDNKSSQELVKKPKLERVKAPTLEEINELKETQNLFHSNLFRLQVKEMLAELKIKVKYKVFINKWLEKLKLFLKKLPSAEDKENINDMKWFKKCPLKLPLNLEALAMKNINNKKVVHFQYMQPCEEPFLIGAAANDYMLGPKLYADICILMPSSCFLKDNYLNIVYDQKRAFYLTYIACKLLEHKVFDGVEIDHMKFNYFGNNPLKPILEITPPTSTGSIANKLIFRIFVSTEETTFKLNRFVPWNNNIRAIVFDDILEDEVLPTSTQNYNANVLFDLTMKKNQQFLKELFETHKNFQEGLLLLKVWLQQRQLNIGFCGFKTYFLAMFICYLQKQKKLHKNMSSYQVARTVWNNLAHSNWDKENGGISLCQPGSDQPNQPTMEQFHTYYSVVFVDVTGYYNICSNLSSDIYQRVRLEAKLAIDILNDMKLNSFQLIFMTKYPIYTQIDHYVKLNSQEAIEQILEMHVQPADKYNYYGYGYPQVLKVVTHLLRKGLNKRVHYLLPIECRTESWRVSENPKNPPKHLHLGVVLNPDFAFEVLEKGPESIAESAEEFRRFWGSKAQLRRFQDGTITESVVWGSSTDTLRQKRLIVRSIINYLLSHHFQLEEQQINYIASEFDMAYRLTPIFKAESFLEKVNISKEVDAVESSLLVIRSFDDLARKLQNLNELPLEIVTISGYSSVFRYCNPVPILPQGKFFNEKILAREVNRGVIQLGLSGKWPNELTALRALKVAFYIQIAEVIRTKFKYPTKVTYDGLLILKSGYCFAIELAHPKEIALLKKEINEKGVTKYVDCPASIELEKRLYVLPKVTSALHALHQQYPSFGPTVMIAKRWLYSQLIDDGLWPDECTELLIASMFLKSKDEQITSTPQIGFIRFLHLLSNSNWKSEMFLLNFNNHIDEKVLSDLEQRFSETRDSFPLLTIVTSFDQKHTGHVWTTNNKPDSHILARVSLLAKQCLIYIERTILSGTDISIQPSLVFKAPNEGYDLIIQIKNEEISTSLAYDYGSSFAVFNKPNWRLPLAGANFLKNAVEKLREAYSDYAAFFYNPCGGKEIGIIWKPPSTFAKKPFKVTNVNGTIVDPEDPTRVQCCKETLIEDFKFVLKDFYLRIDIPENILKMSLESAKVIRTDRYFNKKSTIPKTKKVTNGKPNLSKSGTSEASSNFLENKKAKKDQTQNLQTSTRLKYVKKK